jgi:acyl carrier protein
MGNIEEKSKEEKILKIFGEIFNKDVSELSKDTRLEEDLHAKSLNIVGLIAMIEAEFGTGPTFSSAMKMKRIGEFVDCLE